MIQAAGRTPVQRNTLYGNVSAERIEAGLAAGDITEIVNTPAKKYERKAVKSLVRNDLIAVSAAD